MSFMQPKVPKIPQETKDAQAMQRQAEAERRRELKEQQLRRTKDAMSGPGIRSLISSSSGAGYGRNFF